MRTKYMNFFLPDNVGKHEREKKAVANIRGGNERQMVDCVHKLNIIYVRLLCNYLILTGSCALI